MNKIFSLAIISILLSSCSGDDAVVVEPVQKNDKQLSCEEILFETNDSEYYIKQANEKKALGIKSIVMPLGYIDTYMTADEAISAANQRIGYLKRIYDIRGCEAQADDMKMQRKLQKSLQSQMPISAAPQPMQQNYPYNSGYQQQY
jgi:hypothetical protein